MHPTGQQQGERRRGGEEEQPGGDGGAGVVGCIDVVHRLELAIDLQEMSGDLRLGVALVDLAIQCSLHQGVTVVSTAQPLVILA